MLRIIASSSSGPNARLTRAVQLRGPICLESADRHHPHRHRDDPGLGEAENERRFQERLVGRQGGDAAALEAAGARTARNVVHLRTKDGVADDLLAQHAKCRRSRLMPGLEQDGFDDVHARARRSAASSAGADCVLSGILQVKANQRRFVIFVPFPQSVEVAAR